MENSSEALRLFDSKGFKTSLSANLGEWELRHYCKLGVEVTKRVEDQAHRLYCCGTVVYRGLGQLDSLRQLLNDFQRNAVDQEQLRGHFCVIYWDGERLQLLTDRTRCLHLFVNEQRTCISTSFLAVLAASPRPLPLNQLAVCEKLSTGYIIGPDTLVEGIQQIDDQLAASFTQDRDQLTFVPQPAEPPLRMHRQGRAASVNRQLECLREHFNCFDRLHQEFGGDLGLSDGYDSRLLLACGQFLSKPLTLHTHAIAGVHDRSRRIARQMAAIAGQPVSELETPRLRDRPPERVAQVMHEGLYLFDGRNANSIGVPGETQTVEYKLASLRSSRLSFNGLGGEMYRNYYQTRRWGSFSLRDWMLYHDVYPYAQSMIGDRDLFEAMWARRQEKIARRLGEPVPEKVDFLWTRKFYSLVRVPDCDANNSDAINQLMFYHSPFFDHRLIREALQATDYIGPGGAYQAAMIQALCPALADLPCAGDAPLRSQLGWRSRARYWLREQYPAGWLNSRRQRRLRQLSQRPSIQVDLFSGNPDYRAAIEMLVESRCIRSVEQLPFHYAQGPNAVYVGNWLREFRDKVTWN